MNIGQHRRKPKRFILFPLVGAAMALLVGGIVMLLWNAVLPEATGAHPLRYWQAVGLLILCRILFGNFRGGRFGDGRFGGTERNNWREKWGRMAPEERIRFREEWQRRCRPEQGQNEPGDRAATGPGAE